MRASIDRRSFLFGVGAAALTLPLAGRVGAAERGFSERAYSRATVIDALSVLGFPLSPEALALIKSSGVTAVNATVGVVGNGVGKFEQTIAMIADHERGIAANPDFLMKVLAGRDLDIAKASGRLGVIYGLQDTNVLDGDLSRMAVFHGLGLRVVQPVYNRRNLMGDGCLETADGGLSTLGRELIAEINRLGILLDLSHAAPRTIADGIAASKAPMAITHTGCRALVDVPRNVHDRELRALADKGGVAGIYFMPFLRAAGQQRPEDLIRHLEHAVKVCGEDHVGLGTDGPVWGIPLDGDYEYYKRKSYDDRVKAGFAAPGESPDVHLFIPEYNHERRFLSLAQDLAARSWPASRIEKILGANFARLFREVWR